jgi:hypothetical protein
MTHTAAPIAKIAFAKAHHEVGLVEASLARRDPARHIFRLVVARNCLQAKNSPATSSSKIGQGDLQTPPAAIRFTREFSTGSFALVGPGVSMFISVRPRKLSWVGV